MCHFTRPGREKKPDPKKVMEEKVNTHDEKIEKLESTVSEQRKKIKEMTEKQVELQRALEDQKVDLTACFENKMVIDSTFYQTLSETTLKSIQRSFCHSFLLLQRELFYQNNSASLLGLLG